MVSLLNLLLWAGLLVGVVVASVAYGRSWRVVARALAEGTTPSASIRPTEAATRASAALED